MRYIAHLDMDAFYASVELLRYPELRGKPVVIGGRRPGAAGPAIRTLREYSGRGVITTATYEARVYGLRSGMGLMKAAKLAPDALLLPADFDEYRRHSRLFKEAVRAVAAEIDDRGIDEIYIDLTGLVESGAAGGAPDPWVRARVVATDIRRAVREATGLSCSIGVSPNKLLSKIASELEKPGGLTVVTEADIPARVWPLRVRRLVGIGPKAAARLVALVAVVGVANRRQGAHRVKPVAAHQRTAGCGSASAASSTPTAASASGSRSRGAAPSRTRCAGTGTSATRASSSSAVRSRSTRGA